MTFAPGQTVGPFFHLGLPFEGGNLLVPTAHPDAVRLHGRVFDGEGAGVPDSVIEIWQADPSGRVPRGTGSFHRDGFTFTGWGRAQTDGDGHYWFSTLIPGVTEPGRRPFIAVTVFARGLTDRLFTRAYLPGDEPEALLDGLEPGRRDTLIATREERGLLFDIHLQGEGETVFLSYPRQAR
ncbi:protocatechuate 3,4-dioxygenase subunit alpha [Paractinoplanes lichenicola]|uniref:Protocatechuate 3,4-dioxygenase subunit alpha n=1 Tax=Paractinoplanes lichenicola TaxID=2802976 RepID=A0ABS1W4T6_9ACTN|nr:protocatechuate 3,4-dioxygenase subunit alpha [Actinoplanes lichenicola]MBL7261739.1 protocatechuate 3,4-dioxygenase subunit alpha [Actinoplanes lichenicola]